MKRASGCLFWIGVLGALVAGIRGYWTKGVLPMAGCTVIGYIVYSRIAKKQQADADKADAIRRIEFRAAQLQARKALLDQAVSKGDLELLHTAWQFEVRPHRTEDSPTAFTGAVTEALLKMVEAHGTGPLVEICTNDARKPFREPLLRVLEQLKDPAEALSRLRIPEVVDAVCARAFAEHTRPFWEPADVYLLGRLGTANAVRRLFELCGNQDRVERAAKEALRSVDNLDAAPALLWALSNRYSSEVDLALEILDKLGWKPQADADGVAYWLYRGLPDKCAEFGELAVKPLIGELGNRPGEAAVALGKIGTDEAVDALVRFLNSGSCARHCAIDGLAYVHDGRAVSALASALQDSSKSMRLSAAEKLLALYQSGLMDEAAKQSILSVRGLITESHMDNPRFRHQDNGGNPSCHGDAPTHGDRGIGLQFPS